MRTIIAMMIMLLLGCNDGEFAGTAATAKDKAKKTDNGSENGAPEPGDDDGNDDPNTDGEDGGSGDIGNSDGDLEVEEGGGDDFSKIDNFDDVNIEEYEKKCSDPESLSDPAAKFVFDTSDSVRSFVNERCKIAVPNIGAIHSGDITAKFVCQLKGYQSANVTSKREYSSPSNNFIAHWDDVAKKFLTLGAKGWNTKIHSMECTGKFKPNCSLDAVKINCQ